MWHTGTLWHTDNIMTLSHKMHVPYISINIRLCRMWAGMAPKYICSMGNMVIRIKGNTFHVHKGTDVHPYKLEWKQNTINTFRYLLINVRHHVVYDFNQPIAKLYCWSTKNHLVPSHVTQRWIIDRHKALWFLRSFRSTFVNDFDIDNNFSTKGTKPPTIILPTFITSPYTDHLVRQTITDLVYDLNCIIFGFVKAV